MEVTGLGRMRCLHCTINKRNAFAHIKSDFVFAYEIRFCIQTRMHLYILSVVLHTYTKKILYIYIHIYIYIFMRVYIYIVCMCVYINTIVKNLLSVYIIVDLI